MPRLVKAVNKNLFSLSMLPIVSIHCYQLAHLLYPTCSLEVIAHCENHCSLRKHLTNTIWNLLWTYFLSFHFDLGYFFSQSSRDGATEKLMIAFYYDFFLWRCKNVIFHIVKKGRFWNAWIQVEFSLNLPDFRWKSFLCEIHLLCERKKIYFNPIQDVSFRDCSRIGSGKRPALLKTCHTYPPMMKRSTVISYLKRI